MRRVKGWTSSTIVLGLVLAGLTVAPSASAVPDDVPVVSAGATGGSAKLSGKAYALSVAKAARKSAAKSLWSVPPISRAGVAPLFVPAKGARWFAEGSAAVVDITWESERASGSEMPQTVRVVAAQLRKQLTRRGLKRVYTARGQDFWIYESRSFVCQVDRSSISCLSRAEAKRVLTRVAPFHRALPAKDRFVGMSITLDAKTKRGATKGYLTRGAYHSSPGAFSGASALYYKAPRGRWTFVTGMQDFPPCSVFERSKGARKAYAGFPCYRGSYDNLSKVRR